MKRILFLSILSTISMLSFAQKDIRLNAYGSYVFDESFSAYYDNNNYYNGRINGGFQYGGGLEFMMNPATCLELLYIGQSTHAPINWQAGVTTPKKTTNFKLTANYVMLGSDYHLHRPGSPVEGYAGIFAGALFANADNPDNGNSSSATKFAWDIRLGANIWANENIGIKLQAMLLSSVQAAGGSFYFPGGYVGLSTYSSILQFSLGGGLTFKLGHKK